MRESTARKPAAIFDIDHGRQLNRLRPDLGQRACNELRHRSPQASGRHTLDLLWEEGEGKAPSSGGRLSEDRSAVPIGKPVTGRSGRAAKPGPGRGRRPQVSADRRRA